MQVPELVINEEKKRFELKIEDHLAVLYFEVYESQVWMLTHTLVPDPLKGQGFGSKLVDLVLGYCENNSIRVIPDCPFVRSYIKRYPEWKRILFEQE
jgi:predicted GNAT family acetyltransferase